jgi:hypothetical protein
MARYRSPEAMYLTALIRSLDEILEELQYLRDQGVETVPSAMRQRVDRVLALVPDPQQRLGRSRRITAMQETVFEAQETLLEIRGAVRPRLA